MNAKCDRRSREIWEELEKLDRGIYPESVFGKWGVSRRRVERLKESLYRELAHIRRTNRPTSDSDFFTTYRFRAANLQQLGLNPNGQPINDAACRAPGSVARWPNGRKGTEWAVSVGHKRYADVLTEPIRRKPSGPGPSW